MQNLNYLRKKVIESRELATKGLIDHSEVVHSLCTSLLVLDNVLEELIDQVELTRDQVEVLRCFP